MYERNKYHINVSAREERCRLVGDAELLASRKESGGTLVGEVTSAVGFPRAACDGLVGGGCPVVKFVSFYLLDTERHFKALC